MLLFHCPSPPPQNQVRREITYALRSLPWISVPTVALFFAEVRGYSKLYDNIEDSPYGKLLPHTPSTGRHPLPDTHVTSLGPPISPDDGTPCMSPKKILPGTSRLKPAVPSVSCNPKFSFDPLEEMPIPISS